MDDTFDYFTDEDPLDAVSQRIATVAAKDYDDLLAAHVADYQSLFNNMKLNLCDAPMPEKPTDELLAAYGGRTSNPNTALEDRYLETCLLYTSHLCQNSRAGWDHGAHQERRPKKQADQLFLHVSSSSYFA